jgi:hypothetical protein
MTVPPLLAVLPGAGSWCEMGIRGERDVWLRAKRRRAQCPSKWRGEFRLAASPPCCIKSCSSCRFGRAGGPIVVFAHYLGRKGETVCQSCLAKSMVSERDPSLRTRLEVATLLPTRDGALGISHKTICLQEVGKVPTLPWARHNT